MTRKLKYLLLLLLSLVGISQSHPLGIFSVNRYARIELGREAIRLVYVMDVAEIPSIREFTKIDANADGVADEQERSRYAGTKLAEIAGAFRLTIDGNRVDVRSVAHELSFPEGQGGLKTTRLTSTFEALLSGDSRSHDVHFVDHNFDDRIGWKEIVVRPLDGAEVEQSSVGTSDLTSELRNYPADRLSNPEKITEATIRFLPGSASGGSSVASITQSVISRTKDGFAELISPKELSGPVMFFSLLIAFILGAGHALTPGHGKTIVAAYLVGSRGTAKHAAFLGLTVTATHTIGVFIMGLIALFASRYILPENLFPWLGTASGLIVVGIGLSLARKRIQLARGITKSGDGNSHTHEHSSGQAHDHGDGHGHNHVHTHPGGHTHSHLPPGADGTPVTWKSLLALGVSGGMLPCPSAIVVLLSAVALGRIGFGLLLIVSFSLGLAGVLTGIGLLMVYARRFFERFNTRGRLARWLPVGSALIVTAAGFIIAFQAFAQTGIHLPADFWGASAPLTTGSLSVLGLGFVLGLKHALDADHLVAVSTIVSERKGLVSASLVGALWGLGHTASLLIVGLLVILFHVQIPDRVAMGMEFAVAIMLVILGANLLRKLRNGATLHLHAHAHQQHQHIHPHLHEEMVAHEHSHGAAGHHVVKRSRKPFLIGMVHGMAGSAALMLVVLAAISSRMVALLYIAIFGFGSVGGMFLMSALISVPFAITAKHDGINKIIQTTAGVVSVAFGLFLAWQIGFAEGFLL
jgi:ABC-type nickel/cobalt efflux system permease component RcnA